MILRALTLFCLLQVALTRRNECGEGEFYNRLILACDQCTSGCPLNSYIEKPCTPYEDTQCIECGVVDHENEDFKLKCGVQVDQDFKDAIEVQIRGQLEKMFALKEVKLPREEEEIDSKVDQMLKKINDEWAEPELLSDDDDDDEADEAEDSENEADVAFVITNLEIEDDSDEPRPKIGQGAVPAWDTDSAETDAFRPYRDYKQNERKILKKGNQRRVEPKEIEDESDYEVEEPLKIVKQFDEEDELTLIELEENDRRLVSFEEVDEEREPFPELLPQKIRKRPMPAVRLLDPLFDLDEEEENLKKVDDDSDSDSDDSDENTPVIKEMIVERIKPQVIDFKTWKQQRRGRMNMKWDDDDEDSDSNSDESSEEVTVTKSEHVSLRKRVLRAMALTSFFILVLVLLFWIAKLRRRNRIYRHHISKLRYLTPEERQVIERAAGFLEKAPMNIYENQVYESA